MARTVQFSLVLSEREREALDRLAKAEGGLSRAATIRRLIRMVARAGDLWPQDDPGDDGNRNEGEVSA
jgi:hypothetical protein